jgi:RNA polymerase sigma-70 factor (ECF subfamily)
LGPERDETIRNMTAQIGACATEGLLAPPAVPDADEVLLARVAAGDRDAHRVLYERHGRPVLAFLVGRLRSVPAAEDVLQDVMLDVWRQAARFRGDSKVRTWLLSIAHHQACNYLRRPARRELPVDPKDLPGMGQSPAVDIEANLDLASALARLSDDHQAVLELVLYHGLSVEEAGQVLGVPAGTVKSRLFRARAALRDDLDGEATGHV